MLKQFLDYADTKDERVIGWINTVLKNKIKNKEFVLNVEEAEHIIDFLKSDASPKRIDRMSYEEATKSAEKWVKTLIKKGNEIEETEDDVEVVMDFGDGFKIVKLVGENAFKREGSLMRHCVGSYVGSDKIYSLRDKNNKPHATIEWGNQIKGKGNGSIHPKYVDYVVQFLEDRGMEMRDSEMMNLGYLKLSESQINAVKNELKDVQIYKSDFVFVNNMA